MATLNTKEMRKAIINAIANRSQTKFAKLFHELDSTPTPSNVILVLQELNEQKDFYVDFNIPLKYFLDLYEDIAASNKNFLFNEAGLLVHSATKIYDRRLEFVLQRVEDQLASLAQAGQDDKRADNSNVNKEPKEVVVEKPTRKRKRLVELKQDPFEFQWTGRKFKKLAEGKRFGAGAKIDRSKLFAQKLHVENYLHPALWKYSEIVDLENEDEVDSKRNYRLFTSYVEHRYNTLVPDINFRLYYKMKDFLDAEDERDNEEDAKNIWPPLSQAFVKQYLKIEDRALAHVPPPAKRRRLESPKEINDVVGNDSKSWENLLPSDSGLASLDDANNSENQEQSVVSDFVLTSAVNSVVEAKSSEGQGKLLPSDSGISLSNSNATESTSLENAAEITVNACNKNITSNETLDQQGTLAESGLGSSIGDSAVFGEISNNTDLVSSTIFIDITEDENKKPKHDSNPAKSNNENESSKFCQSLSEDFAINTGLNSTQLEAANVCNKVTEDQQQTSSETVALTVQIETDNKELNDQISYHAQPSPQNDEGVCFSDIDDAPLTPLTIHVEKSIFNGVENTKSDVDMNKLEEFRLAPHQTPVEFWPVKLNIFEFPREIIKKMRRPKLLTDLGEEMELFLKARFYKRSRCPNESSNTRQFKLFNRSASSASDIYDTPPPSPGTEAAEVLLGFEENGKPRSRPLSNEDGINTNQIPMQALKIGDHQQRLSRDSGVDETVTPEKHSPLLPSITEEEQLKRDNVCKNILNAADAEIQASNAPITENIETEKLVENNENLSKDQPTNIEKATSDKNLPKDIEKTSSNADIEADSFMDITNFNHSEPLNEDAALINGDKHVELADDTVARIQTWHRTLQPILAKSRERHHFDVFQIGTNILSEFDNEPQPNDSITFQNVMQHQDPSYVSRYFLSMLLLANQGNIGLKVNNKNEDKPSEWCDVSFKLLSTTRHVVAVEDNIGMLPTKPTPPTKTLKSPIKITTANANSKPTPPKPKSQQPQKLAELLPPPPPPCVPSSCKKRKLSSTAADATAISAAANVNVIGTIKPIGKTPRLSSSEDSGIASLESDFDLTS